MIVVPLPKSAVHGDEQLKLKTCQQYALTEYAENLVIVDNGFGKVHTSYVPLQVLRSIPGFERAHVVAPLGGRGNSIRYLAIAPRDNALKVKSRSNLFCGGEKAGVFVGHTEAIVTGSLAGHNAARQAAGKEPLVLPQDTLLGDIIAHVNEQMQTEQGLSTRYTFSGSTYFERLKQLGMYTTDVEAIKARVKKQGYAGIFNQKLM
ncbi:MAG: FAD-dependent oxidoreductase [Chloroflexota bacterium]|nr:FAD-dependent oxidoreductase [Chloroflexota bacterium]